MYRQSNPKLVMNPKGTTNLEDGDNSPNTRCHYKRTAYTSMTSAAVHGPCTRPDLAFYFHVLFYDNYVRDNALHCERIKVCYMIEKHWPRTLPKATFVKMRSSWWHESTSMT